MSLARSKEPKLVWEVIVGHTSMESMGSRNSGLYYSGNVKGDWQQVCVCLLIALQLSNIMLEFTPVNEKAHSLHLHGQWQ